MGRRTRRCQYWTSKKERMSGWSLPLPAQSQHSQRPSRDPASRGGGAGQAVSANASGPAMRGPRGRACPVSTCKCYASLRTLLPCLLMGTLPCSQLCVVLRHYLQPPLRSLLRACQFVHQVPGWEGPSTGGAPQFLCIASMHADADWSDDVLRRSPLTPGCARAITQTTPHVCVHASTQTVTHR